MRIDERRREMKWKALPLQIAHEDCIVCDACQRACPPQFGAIINTGTKVVIVPELCSGCDQCLRVCPIGCIHPSPDWIETPTDLWGLLGVGGDPYTNTREPRHPINRSPEAVGAAG